MRVKQTRNNPPSFLLRVWKVPNNGSPVWKAMLISNQTNESQSFPNLESLNAYLNGVTLIPWNVADENHEFDLLGG